MKPLFLKTVTILLYLNLKVAINSLHHFAFKKSLLFGYKLQDFLVLFPDVGGPLTKYVGGKNHLYVYIQGVPGGMCQTSAECSLR